MQGHAAMTVEEIFSQAKALFVYESDQVCFGKTEYWAALPELEQELCKTKAVKGDCDDFATWCVGKLRESGLRARYIICQVETGEWHCIAECEGVILDNRQSSVVPFSSLPYKWYGISGYNPGDSWHRISES